MNPLWRAGSSLVWLVLTARLDAQSGPHFTTIQRLTNQEIRLMLSAPAGSNYLIQAATQLPNWDGLLTLRSAGMNGHTDSAAAYLVTRYYRAVEVTGSNVLTGDHLVTTNGDVVMHPVNHAGFVLGWNDKWIYCDPVGGSFAGIPKADLVLITHSHSDHFNAMILAGIWQSGRTTFIAPQAVYNSLGDLNLFKQRVGADLGIEVRPRNW
jgi:Beta-lactamase superfamily domain